MGCTYHWAVYTHSGDVDIIYAASSHAFQVLFIQN